MVHTAIQEIPPMPVGVLACRKWWEFFMFQRLKLDDTKQTLIRRLSFEQLRSSIKSTVTWRRVAWADALIHTILGFIIVTVIAYAVPEVIHDTTRLAVFWGVMFSHLFLGFLALIALYRNLSGILKFIAGAIILLQMCVLGMSSNYNAHCKGISTVDTMSKLEHQDCQNLSFLSSHIILPNFLHSFIFCAILITYLYKRAGVLASTVDPNYFDEIDGKLNAKQSYQFAHITVIVEEVI